MTLTPKMRGEGLNVGDIVILDDDMAHSSEVQIINKSFGGKYCLVKNIGAKNTEGWEVMSYRLTKKISI